MRRHTCRLPLSGASADARLHFAAREERISTVKSAFVESSSKRSLDSPEVLLWEVRSCVGSLPPIMAE